MIKDHSNFHNSFYIIDCSERYLLTVQSSVQLKWLVDNRIKWRGQARSITSSLANMASLCRDASRNENFHLDKKTTKSDHYRFLYSVRADCVQCVEYWLQQGLDPQQGTQHHSDWNAVEFAKHFNATRPGVTKEDVCTWYKSLNLVEAILEISCQDTTIVDGCPSYRCCSFRDLSSRCSGTFKELSSRCSGTFIDSMQETLWSEHSRRECSFTWESQTDGSVPLFP